MARRLGVLFALVALSACEVDPCDDAVVRTEPTLDAGAARIDLHPGHDGWEQGIVEVVDADQRPVTRVVQTRPTEAPVVAPDGSIHLAPGGPARWEHCVLPHKLTTRCVVGDEDLVVERNDDDRIVRLASGGSVRTFTWDACGRPDREVHVDASGASTVITYAHEDGGHLSGWTEEGWEETAEGSVPVVVEVDVEERRGGRPHRIHIHQDDVWRVTARYDSKGRIVDVVGPRGQLESHRYHGRTGLPVKVYRDGRLVYEEGRHDGEPIVRWDRTGDGQLVEHEVHEAGDRTCIAPARYTVEDWVDEALDATERRAERGLDRLLSLVVPSPGPY